MELATPATLVRADVTSGIGERCFAWLAVGILFGDWFLLTLSRLATGSTGNWMVAVAAVQLVGVALAAAVGRLDVKAFGPAFIGLTTTGMVLVGHAMWRSASGGELTGYGWDKLLAWFASVIPAYLLGFALARRPVAMAPRVMAVTFVPLIVVALFVTILDRERITLRYVRDLPVVLGFLVLPVHQALAFCLAKGGLWSLSRIDSGSGRRFWLTIVLFSTALILLTGARTYLMAFIAAGAVVMLFGRRAILPSLIAAAVIAPVFEFMANEALLERYDPLRALQSLAWIERWEAWIAASDAFLEAPLFGLGPGGYGEFIYWSGRVYPHNLVLELAAEVGLFGVIGLVVAVVWTFGSVFRAWRRGPAEPMLRFACAFFVFALIGAMAVGDWIRNGPLFLALGLCAGAVHRSES